MQTDSPGSTPDNEAETQQPLAAAPTPHFRPIPVMLALGLILAVLYSLALAKSLVVPLVLASFMGLGLNPLVVLASRIRIPRALSALLVMLALGAGVAGSVIALTPPAIEWLQQAPRAIRHDLAPKLAPLTRKLEEANRATQSLTGDKRPAPTPDSAKPTLDIWDVVSITPPILAFALTVGLLVFFFLIYGDRMLLKLVEVSPSFRSKRDVVSIVRGIQSEVSRYIFTRTAINLILGVITAALLWWLGVSDPWLWGTLAALANFVPYVGAIGMTGLLAVVGIMQFHPLPQALAPAAFFAVLTAVEGNLITPLIMGRRLRLSPVAILIWLLIWAWLWGVAGALLAVPMLTSFKLIAERIDGWEWLAHLVGR
ncbi:MAG: AI-2E family transporter [Rhodanobacteraceae bacterium]